MRTHTFAVCAYKDSPYLEACIRSLRAQTVPSEIIICTSTPSSYIENIANEYQIPYFCRNGKSNIRDDWNFAYEKADTELVTIAHQDDLYYKYYTESLQNIWEKYPDTTVFSTDCAVIKYGQLQKREMVGIVKKILRLPLRLRFLAHMDWIKKLSVSFGNPIICPSCTYDKVQIGDKPFQSELTFALDWDFMLSMARRPGRFIVDERPLLLYRIHDQAETKACIDDHRREHDEICMYKKIWPGWFAKILMMGYSKAYKNYDI